MIVDSTNPRIMADNIRELAINGGGSGLPEVTAADNGKILGVVEGSWNKMDAPSGGIDYSTTEQNTGRKWIDGKDIYQKTYSLPLTWSAQALDIILEENFTNTPIDYNFTFDGIPKTISKYQITSDTLYVSNDDKLVLYISKSSSWEGFNHITATVYYTKTTTTKKRKTTKGEN